MDTTHCPEAPSRYAVAADGVPVGADAIHPEPWASE